MTGIKSGEKPIIKVRGLHKYFGHVHVIKGVNLDVRPKEVVVIIGPSGGRRAATGGYRSLPVYGAPDYAV